MTVRTVISTSPFPGLRICPAVLGIVLLLMTVSAFAEDPIVSSVVLGDVKVRAPGGSLGPAQPGTPLAPGSVVQTGSTGEVSIYFGSGSRIIALGNSNLTLIQASPSYQQQVSASGTVGSAIKSLFTHNDSRPIRSQTVLEAAGIELSSGSVVSVVVDSRQVINLPMGFIYATNGSFVTTIESPDCVRLTVQAGYAALGLPDGNTVPIKAGEFLRFCRASTRSGYILTGPAAIGQNPQALADLRTFGNKTEALDPVAAFIADPAIASPGAVGTGLSAPFDLKGTTSSRQQRLTTPANAANVLGPVISPSR